MCFDLGATQREQKQHRPLLKIDWRGAGWSTPFFVRINTSLYQWKKYPQDLLLLFNHQKTAQLAQSPKRRNFAQSGHPDLGED
jgi:hypothetical protein